MDSKLSFAFTLLLVLFSSYLEFSRAAAIGPNDKIEDNLMRQFAALAAQSDDASDESDRQLAEKRYSQAQYTSARGSSLDRAAVRRLLSMLVGKRSKLAQKRSHLSGAADSATAFDDVKGYVLIAGKITNDMMDEVLDQNAQVVDLTGSE